MLEPHAGHMDADQLELQVRTANSSAVHIAASMKALLVMKPALPEFFLVAWMPRTFETSLPCLVGRLDVLGRALEGW